MPVQTQTFTSNGSWVCPAGINFIKVECWGAGGSGGNSSRANGRGGGGAGGNYSRSNVVYVSPGFTYTVIVGLGGSGNRNSSFGYTGNKAGYQYPVYLVLATGGVNGANTMSQSDPANAAGGVATTTGCVGDVIYSGGNGAAGSSPGSGGGGAGAVPTANGGNASGTTGGSAPVPYAKTGADGVSPASNGNVGAAIGGGGSGGANSAIQFTTRYGGIGGQGQVTLTWGEPDPTQLCVYSNCNPLAVNCYIYEDQALTTPITRSGYFSDNTNCYTVNSSGMITSVTGCCPAYGTYYYAFCSGGSLYYKYHNGSCGYYDQLIVSCDAGCGCDSGCYGGECV